MDDSELLRREIRATREELVRRRSPDSEDSDATESPAGLGSLDESGSRLPLMPDREDEFLRLALMSVAELESHVDRLERDLADLEDGLAAPEE